MAVGKKGSGQGFFSKSGTGVAMTTTANAGTTRDISRLLFILKT
jgi:hypothetical protein